MTPHELRAYDWIATLIHVLIWGPCVIGCISGMLDDLVRRHR